tara:strand:- start:81 stop:1589 length:1509 start_codon:yes stop_codon:yes gene_type:complete
MQNNIQKIVIVGGGTAGWMTAAAMGKLLKNRMCSITLVESAEVPTIGVGEATIPQLHLFNALLDLDEDEFVRETNATFKHGIQFVDWKHLGHEYIHPFGTIGLNFDGVDFHHYWLKTAKAEGIDRLDNYAFNCVAARENKMMRSVDVPNSPLNNIAYAFHFDAGLYVKWLKKFAISQGVERIEAHVNKVHLDNESGFIKTVELADGKQIEADLFIDCSGFKGLLIEEALHTGYESWSHLLPCDSAVVVPSKNTGQLYPYTRSWAQKAGWQWRIPLQHRTGNGHVFSSKYMSDAEAKDILLANIEGEPLAEPRFLRFQTGMRRKQWHKNCVAIGLSSGFIEPLESTSIHLIQSSISRLMSLFPDKHFDPVTIETFNKQADEEIRRIRDFIILHYHLTERQDTGFWRYCNNMEIPDYLQNKIELFKKSGRVFRENDELFNQSSWIAVMIGQGLMPEQYHPMADLLEQKEVSRRLAHVKQVIQQSVDRMPEHQTFIDQHCKSKMN